MDLDEPVSLVRWARAALRTRERVPVAKKPGYVSNDRQPCSVGCNQTTAVGDSVQWSDSSTNLHENSRSLRSAHGKFSQLVAAEGVARVP